MTKVLERRTQASRYFDLGLAGLPTLLLWGLFAALAPGEAAAQAYPSPGGLPRDPSVSLTFRSVYHAYQVRLFTDPVVTTSTLTGLSTRAPIDTFRNVNPLSMSLEGSVVNVGPGGDFDTILSLRYNTDFGTGFHRDTPPGAGIPAVDGRHDVDLLLLYVDWKNVVRERLDLRLGRQLLLDDLDWYTLDGAKATAHLARTASVSLDVEAYVGMPVRIGRVFDSEAFISDGYEVSDGPGLAFGGAAFAKLFGVALSAAYRQELVFRGDDLAVFRPAGLEIEEVRAASAGKFALMESLLGASAGYTIPGVAVDLHASMVLNLVFGKLDLLRAGVAFNPDRDLHLSAEVMHVYPRFAADSIFNIFNIFPYTRGRLDASYEIIPGLTAELGYFILAVQGSASSTGLGPEFAGEDLAQGPSGGVTYRTETLAAGISAEASTNFGGKYAFGGNYRRVELFGDASFLDDRAGATLRGGLTTVQNDWYEELDAGEVATAETSYTLGVGGRAKLTEAALVRLDFIKNFESLFEGSYRILGVLELRY